MENLLLFRQMEPETMSEKDLDELQTTLDSNEKTRQDVDALMADPNIQLIAGENMQPQALTGQATLTGQAKEVVQDIIDPTARQKGSLLLTEEGRKELEELRDPAKDVEYPLDPAQPANKQKPKMREIQPEQEEVHAGKNQFIQGLKQIGKQIGSFLGNILRPIAEFATGALGSKPAAPERDTQKEVTTFTMEQPEQKKPYDGPDRRGRSEAEVKLRKKTGKELKEAGSEEEKHSIKANAKNTLSALKGLIEYNFNALKGKVKDADDHSIGGGTGSSKAESVRTPQSNSSGQARG